MRFLGGFFEMTRIFLTVSKASRRGTKFNIDMNTDATMGANVEPENKSNTGCHVLFIYTYTRARARTHTRKHTYTHTHHTPHTITRTHAHNHTHTHTCIYFTEVH